jgi:hypothetical protein
MVIFPFVLAIVIEDSLDILVQLLLLLVEVHHDIVIVLLFLLPDLLDFLHGLSKLPQFLDFWSQLLLPVFDLSFNFENSGRNFLE